MRRIKTWLGGVALAAVVSAMLLAAGILASARFDKDGMKLAVAMYRSVGDYFEAYEAGVAAQAKAAGIELHVFEGKQNAAEMREQIEQAISLGVNGILIDHGLPKRRRTRSRRRSTRASRSSLRRPASTIRKCRRSRRTTTRWRRLVLEQALQRTTARHSRRVTMRCGWLQSDRPPLRTSGKRSRRPTPVFRSMRGVR